MVFRFRSLSRLVQLALADPGYFWLLAGLVVVGDAVLTKLIIRFVPYTEIDWVTYMAQVQVYLKGQLNYSQITGPTGPLVYPAGHVHIHRGLHHLTDSGRDIPLAQHIYGALYILSLCLTCVVYRQAGSVPNWIVLLLPLSKRLHSIYALRLFNDCWAVVAMQAAVVAYQKGLDNIGTLLFSAALSAKMSVLLYLPGILVIIFKREGLLFTLRALTLVILSQIFIALPFIRENPWDYLASSFNLSRVFMYEWTVNWRFVNEETFLSSRWAKGLLIGHVSALIAFGMYPWCRKDGSVWTVIARGLRRPNLPAGLAPVTPDYIATVLFTSNLIGIIFARSLHYQFYSWYAQQIPFLAYKTPFPLPLKLFLMVVVELAWNTFPSTPLSSGALLGAHAVLLTGIWFERRGRK